MSNLLLMNAVLALSSTHVVTNAATPIWLEPISAAYQDCLFGVIDRQYETKRFSEGRALSQCANVRRVQKARAIAAVVIMGGAHRGERMVDREFVRLDDMARAIVGHIRSRYEGGMIQAAAPAPDADSLAPRSGGGRSRTPDEGAGCVEATLVEEAVPAISRLRRGGN